MENKGVYAKILMPFFFIRLVTVPLSMIICVFEKNKLLLFLQSMVLISSLGIFAATITFQIAIDIFLNLFYWGIFLNYLVWIFLFFPISKGGFCLFKE